VEAAQIFSVVEEIGDSGWLGFATDGTKRMITVLTLCSANYLAQARSLGESVLEHKIPGITCVIGIILNRRAVTVLPATPFIVVLTAILEETAGVASDQRSDLAVRTARLSGTDLHFRDDSDPSK
jgi:hypothetical protein